MRSSRSSKRARDSRFVDAVDSLVIQTVSSLFRGQEIVVESWTEVAEHYRRETATSRGRPPDLRAEATGILASIICSHELETARGLARSFPNSSESEFYVLAAEAIIYDRITRSNASVAAPHAKLAESLYALMPKYFANVDSIYDYVVGSLRILSEYISFFSCVDDFSDKLTEASALTAGASHLASSYGIFRYVESVREIGDGVIAEHRDRTGRDAMGVWTIANNLANLCVSLAKDQPPANRREYGQALAYANLSLAAVDSAVGEGVSDAREATVRRLAELHAALAVDENHRGEHAAEAQRWSDAYTSATSNKEAATRWSTHMSQALDLDSSDSREAEYRRLAQRFEVQSYLAIERIGEWPQKATERIASTEGGTEARARVIDEIIGPMYDELGAELERAISSSGFDWCVCKMLLALGAIASGRLGELTAELVSKWFSTATLPQETESWTAFRARQYVPTDDNQSERAEAAGRIVALANLAELVERRCPDTPLQNMLRARNAELLQRIITRPPLFQECSRPALSPDEDLRSLLKAGRHIFRSRFT